MKELHSLFFFSLKNKKQNFQEENLNSAGLEEQTKKMKEFPNPKGQEGEDSFRQPICFFD